MYKVNEVTCCTIVDVHYVSSAEVLVERKLINSTNVYYIYFKNMFKRKYAPPRPPPLALSLIRMSLV